MFYCNVYRSLANKVSIESNCKDFVYVLGIELLLVLAFFIKTALIFLISIPQRVFIYLTLPTNIQHFTVNVRQHIIYLTMAGARYSFHQLQRPQDCANAIQRTQHDI